MKLFGYIASGMAGAIIAALVVLHPQVTGTASILPPKSAFTIDFSYTDLLTVMFAAATLILTAVALMVGLFAIFTYQGMKEEIGQRITKGVEEKMEELDQRIEREVGEEADEKIERAIERAARSGKLKEVIERVSYRVSTGQGIDLNESGEKDDFDENLER